MLPPAVVQWTEGAAADPASAGELLSLPEAPGGRAVPRRPGRPRLGAQE